MSLAKVTIIGNLGRDAETRYTPSGALNVTFSVAASRKWRDGAGQDQESTTWFRVTAWGRLAETLVRLQEAGALGKGQQVYVEGRLEAREYQAADGATRTSLDVNATEVQLLGSRPEQGAGTAREQFRGGGYEATVGGSQDLNDIPF